MVQKELASIPKPRGRPRAFDTATVLRKARDTFWRGGYSATSLDDLSEATGLNRPSLYGAFGDKRALYLAALTHSRDEMIAALERGLANPADLRTTLTTIYAAAAAIYAAGDIGQRGCFLVGTAVTESVVDPQVRALLDAAFAHTDALFQARFEADSAQVPSGVEPAALGRMASGVLHTLAVRARAGADEATLRATYEGAVNLICGRLSPR